MPSAADSSLTDINVDQDRVHRLMSPRWGSGEAAWWRQPHGCMSKTKRDQSRNARFHSIRLSFQLPLDLNGKQEGRRMWANCGLSLDSAKSNYDWQMGVALLLCMWFCCWCWVHTQELDLAHIHHCTWGPWWCCLEYMLSHQSKTLANTPPYSLTSRLHNWRRVCLPVLWLWGQHSKLIGCWMPRALSSGQDVLCCHKNKELSMEC